MKIELDMYQTLAIAVLVLMLGAFFKKTNLFSGEILHSVSGHRRTAFCNFHLHLLQYRTGRIFF